jgi:hypothetical protein
VEQQRRARETFAKLPLYFEPNVGQMDPAVKFVSRGPGHALYLTPSEMVLVARGTEKPATVGMELAGGNPLPRVLGAEPLPGKTNYFIGNYPAQWHTNVETYAKVRYESVYPGIDLIYHGNNRELEYDFVVAPGAHPGAIRMKLAGAEKLEITADGDLLVHAGGADVVYRKPVVYQPETESPSESKEFVEGHYVLRGDGEVAFEVAKYDAAKPLVIDPTVVFSTFLGGANDDGALFGVATDSFGNVYVTGGTTTPATASPPFPVTAGAFQTTYGGTGTGCGAVPTFQCGDAFVAEIKSDGSALVYATYLGGNDRDMGFGIAVDGSGNAYITGTTNSNNFPVSVAPNPLPFQGSNAGGRDAFLSKLDSTGSKLLYSTYLGGSNKDEALGLALGATAGRVYIVGDTGSIGATTNFPTTGGVVETVASCVAPNCSVGPQHGFIAEIDTTQSGAASLVFSTLLGGNESDQLVGIAVDGSGNIYVAGATTSTNLYSFPVAMTANPIQPGGFGGGGTACATNQSIVCGDGLVAKLNGTGTKISYLTYLGGSGEDSAFEIVVDSAGNAYVSGGTDTNNATATNKFPITPGAFQTTFGGSPAGCVNTGIACGDGFLAKINPAGNALVYSTYIGGSGDDIAFGVQVDFQGNAYVTGITNSSDFPVTKANALQGTFGGGSTGATCTNGLICGDGFLVMLDPTGSRALFSTYSGSTGDDGGFGLAMDPFGNLVASGATSSANFPVTPGAFQTTYGGGADDAFVAKFTLFSFSPCTNTFTGGAGTTDWGTPANWSRLGPTGAPLLPDAFDNACLGNNNVTVSGALPALNQTVNSVSATGGTLTISGGALTIGNHQSSSTLNNVVVSGGTLTTDPGTTIAGTLTVSSGTLSANSLSGFPTVVTGVTTISGGTITGASGSALSANGGLSITGSATLDTITLNSNGTSAMSGGFTILFLANGAQLNIPSGATFDLMDSDGIRPGAGAAGSISNSGTFTKSLAGSAATLVSAPLLNGVGGTVSVGAGTLELTNPGSSGNGNYTVASGAFLQLTGQSLQSGHKVSGLGSVIFSGTPSSLSGGTYSVSGTTTFTAAGNIPITLGEIVTLGPTMVSGGSVSFGSGVILNPLGPTSPLTINGGTVTFGTAQAGGASIATLNFSVGTIVNNIDTITIPVGGTLNWTGGTFQGTAGLVLNGTGTLSGAGTGTLTGSPTGEGLTVNGTFTQSGTATLDIENSALITVNTGGTYNLQSTGGVTSSSTGAALPTLIIAGTFGFADPPPSRPPQPTGNTLSSQSGSRNHARPNQQTGTGFETAMTIFTIMLAGADVHFDTGAIAFINGVSVGGSSMGAPIRWIIQTNAAARAAVSAAIANAHVTVNGTLNADAGGTMTIASNVTVDGTGTLLITDTTTVAAGATIDVANINVMSGGTLLAVGTFGNATAPTNVTNNGGVVQPHMSSGILTINGSYTQSSTGTLAIEIDGTTAGTQYSQLMVNGTATLAGTLQLIQDNGFVPAVGDTFTIVPATGEVGIFATINTGTFPAFPAFSASYIVPPGVVLQAAGNPTLNATPNPLAFGSVPEETTSTMSVTFTNTGSGTLMITGGLNPSGGNAGDFKPTGGTCGATPISITPGPGCTVTYAFTPTTGGAESTTVTVTSNATNTPPALTLSGTGIAPNPNLVGPSGASSMTFANQPVGTASAPMTATLSVKAGSGTLLITGITVSMVSTGGATTDFVIDTTAAGMTTCPNVNVTGATPQPLAGGASCTIGVDFTPTTTGTRLGQVNVFASDFGNGFPQILFLSGDGVPNTAPPVSMTATSGNGVNGGVSSIVQGDTATFPVTVTVNAGFSGVIQFACMAVTASGAPTTIPSTIVTTSPASITVTASANAQTFTEDCTIQTNCVAMLVGPRPPWNGPGPWTPAPLAGMSGLALLLAMLCRKLSPATGRGRGGGMVPLGAAVLLVLLVMTWTACVSNPPPAIPNAPTTPVGVYHIQLMATVTATKQVVTLPQPLTLNII